MKSTKTGLSFEDSEDDEKKAALLLLMPLVEMAWAHGAVSAREKRVIFEAARAASIDARDALNETLDELLKYRPGRDFFDDCRARIDRTLRSMTVKDRRALHARLIALCRAVAAAAGDRSPMDLNHHISPEEQALLERYAALLD